MSVQTIAGFGIGVCLGVAGGFFAFSGDGETNDMADSSVMESKDDGQSTEQATPAQVESLKSKLDTERAKNTKLSAELKSARAAVKSLGGASDDSSASESEVSKKLQAQSEEIAELKQELQVYRDQEAKDEQEKQRILAEKKAKATLLIADIKSSIAEMDKKAVLDSLSQLQKLGVDVADEFFEAFLAVAEVGQAWGGNNSLGLTFSESASLFPPEFQIYALNNEGGNVPEEARIAAAYYMPWQPGGLTNQDKVDMMAKLVTTDSTQTTQNHAVAALSSGNFRTEESRGKLMEFYDDPSTPSSTRASALLALTKFEKDEEITQKLEDAELSTDQAVADAARAYNDATANGVKGYLVVSYTPNENGVPGVLRPGDIITSIDGNPPAGGWQIMGQLNKEGTLALEVLRNGQSLAISLEGQTFKLDGSSLN